jgi:tol-pal system protein YbgF
MGKRALGVLLIVLLPMVSSGQDKSKKTYELIYQDVQQLKQEFLKLEKRLDAAAEDLRLIKDQLKDLAGQLKLVQSQQARSQDSLNNIPAQTQALLEKFQQIDGQMLKIIEEVMALKNQPTIPVSQEQEPLKKDEKAPVAKKAKETPKETKKEEPVKDKKTAPPVPPKTSLSAQELYNTAYSDYEKGNYDLAIDGLLIYREQFPSSPYADDALYWIGECYFSQKKYAKAIEQFNDLIIGYPLSNKIATAYLKKGFSLAELKKKDEAVAVLKLLITKYPLEEEAKNAQEKLKELQGIK